ncbi:LysR family transcriptional regulator [Brevundimonas sp. LM2]|uniref:LysR family transcriptional regulator n=1 Tax=Brevundimonas sp. LM2 TaxID=1938605 RepID=UPI000983F072|nr:LysR family transcriptional regulator [Brevundimonas sp. LM2]AQR63064.1 LysR family transcriptional regulator [Brevundimonas sp. LM2]
MARDSLNDLSAFAAVADARSFTRAAEKLGSSPSALSHAMRGLEERLGVRLLTRTTRSVTTTDAGERLLLSLRPALADIDSAVVSLRSSRDTPAGSIRVTAVKHAITSVILPMLPEFMRRYPDIRIELDVDDALSDIVANGYDAGVRFSGSVDKDMLAVRIGPEIEVVVVASPAYLAPRSPLETPKDLDGHDCIVHRRPGGRGSYPWAFQQDGRFFQLRMSGPLSFNDSDLVLASALAGQGVAYVFRDFAAPHIATGELIEVLSRSTVNLPGYDLYYPSRRQNPPALARFIESLRHPVRSSRSKP